MDVSDFTQEYSRRTDDELLCLWADRDTLFPEATIALESELQRRGLDKRNAGKESVSNQVAAADSNQPILQKIIDGSSSLLLLVGAIVFLLGGKFFYEVKHENFLMSEVGGIMAGVLLMMLGAGIAIAGRSPKSKHGAPRKRS